VLVAGVDDGSENALATTIPSAALRRLPYSSLRVTVNRANTPAVASVRATPLIVEAVPHGKLGYTMLREGIAAKLVDEYRLAVRVEYAMVLMVAPNVEPADESDSYIK
jgi:hypothetical protein